jgi:hypothetical protein
MLPLGTVQVEFDKSIMPALSGQSLYGNRSASLMITTAWAMTGLCCVYYLFLITNGDFNLS